MIKKFLLIIFSIIILSSILLTSCTLEQEIFLKVDDVNLTTDEIDFNSNLLIIIHMEPGNFPDTTEQPGEYWDELVDLVELANQHNLKLNLMFNPQWGTYILEEEERLNLVREWESDGHVLGVHHHGPQMGAWNGYTNQENYIYNSKYLGTIEDMMGILNQLPVSGQMLVGVISNDDDKNYDFPENFIYSLDGGINSFEDLMSTPEPCTYNNQDLICISHAIYGTGGEVAVSLEEIELALTVANEDQVVGIVFHANNFGDAPIPYVILFEYLNKLDIESVAISDLNT